MCFLQRLSQATGRTGALNITFGMCCEYNLELELENVGNIDSKSKKCEKSRVKKQNTYSFHDGKSVSVSSHPC